MTKIGLPLFTSSPSSLDSYSSKALLADFARLVAGNARALYEMTSGQGVSGTEPCAPPSPVGGIGEHHTGGGHGTIIPTTIWQASGGYTDGNADVDKFFSINDGSLPVQRVYQAHIPACHAGGGYESATLHVVTYVGVTRSGETYTIKPRGSSSSITLAKTAGYADSTIVIALEPGKLNKITLDISTASTHSDVLDIIALAIIAS